MDIQLSATKFLAFVKAKPASEEYNAWNGKKCAVAQFLISEFPNTMVQAGFDISFIGELGLGEYLKAKFTIEPSAEQPWSTQPMMDLILADGWTFGELATRLEAASHFMRAVAAEQVGA